MALCALFRVGRDPVARLRVVLALLQPALDDRATARSVISVERATEAEDVTARALDGRDDDVEGAHRDGAVDRVFAVRGGAPTHARVVVDVGAVQQSSVPVSQAQGTC